MKETENDEDDENQEDGDLEEELDEDGNLEEKLKKYQEETEGGSVEFLGNDNAKYLTICKGILLIMTHLTLV